MKRPLCLICLILSVILLFYAPIKKSHINSFSDMSDKPCSYEGTLKDIQFKVTSEHNTQILYMSGDVNVIVYPDRIIPDLRIGANLKIIGTAYSFTPARNEGMFDSLTYYNSLGYSYGIKNASVICCSASYNHFSDALYRIRRYFCTKIDTLLPAQEASIIKTMLLGQKKEIDTDLKDLYMRNGIAHILSISGLHISIIGLGFFKLLKRIGIRHKLSAVISFVFMFIYGLMAGLSISSLRAIMMFAISMLAILFERTYDLLTSVSLISTFLMLTNSLLIYNSAYIFSFGTIYGITIILPTLTSPSVSENKPDFFISKVLNSLAMSIITLPIYYYCYFQLPIYSVLLNFLVLPVMGILIGCSVVMLTASCISISLAEPLKFLIIGILKIFKRLADFFDTLPYHYYTPGKPKIWQIILFIIISIVLYLTRKKLLLVNRYIIMLFAILIITVRFNPPFEMCMLDVGQGECIFLRYSKFGVTFPGITPEFTVLFDGGSTDISSVGKYRITPFLKSKGASCIDAIFISHTDADHINGILEMLDSYGQEGITIKNLILPAISDELKNDSYRMLEVKATALGIPISYFSAGDSLSYNELTLTCVWPNGSSDAYAYNSCYLDANNCSMVVNARYLRHSILVTGDITSETENKIALASPIEILMVPHHGSRGSSSMDFLSRVRPSVSLISAGIDNQYGHPHKETLSRLNSINSVIFRTDLFGQISIVGNSQLSVTPFITQ